MLLFQLERINRVFTLRLVTPIHHPYIFTPVGKAYSESLEELHRVDRHEQGAGGVEAAGLRKTRKDGRKGRKAVPPWGAVFRHQIWESIIASDKKQLDKIYELLANDYWDKLCLPFKDPLPMWHRWIYDTG